MTITNGKAQDVTSALDQLRVSGQKSKKLTHEPAESWEDGNSDGEEEAVTGSAPVRPNTSDLPRAPPPTPHAHAHAQRHEHVAAQGSLPDFDFVNGTFNTAPAGSETSMKGEEKRPEKSIATASRLIAMGIGQKPTRRTEEQRKYDQAMKIQEKKKRDQAREAENTKKLEAEQAKKAIWDD